MAAVRLVARWFALNTAGTGFTNLHSFSRALKTLLQVTNTNSDGIDPHGSFDFSGQHPVMDGVRWRAVRANGTVFAVNTDGNGFYDPWHSFRQRLLLIIPTATEPVRMPELVLSGNTLYGRRLAAAVRPTMARCSVFRSGRN